jgi:Holliday junction resolvasome RuvABC DNA-binding subunit
MANKITKKQKYSALINYLMNKELTEELADGITVKDILDLADKEIENLDKKSASKSSKENPEKIAKMEQALGALKALGKPSTVTEVVAEILATDGVALQNQSVSWYLNQAVKDGVVAKSTQGKKTLFEYIGEDEDIDE